MPSIEAKAQTSLHLIDNCRATDSSSLLMVSENSAVRETMKEGVKFGIELPRKLLTEVNAHVDKQGVSWSSREWNGKHE